MSTTWTIAQEGHVQMEEPAWREEEHTDAAVHWDLEEGTVGRGQIHAQQGHVHTEAGATHTSLDWCAHVHQAIWAPDASFLCTQTEQAPCQQHLQA